MESIEGYWGPRTSNVDWCEPNYYYTPYVAEFFNTISSVPMIIYGLYGMIKTWKSQLGSRFPLGHFVVFLVGVGSTMFHMTLLYQHQMLDELPMIIGSLVFVFILFDLGNEEKNSRVMLIATILILYGIVSLYVMSMFTQSVLPMNLSYVFLVAFFDSSISFHLSKWRMSNSFKSV